MQELYEKGVATHLGPEPCVVTRKGGGEASVGVRAGQAIEPRNSHVLGADAIEPGGRQQASRRYREPAGAQRGPRPRHARRLIAREPGGPVIGHGAKVPWQALGILKEQARW
jgi:hypothetical protein